MCSHQSSSPTYSHQSLSPFPQPLQHEEEDENLITNNHQHHPTTTSTIAIQHYQPSPPQPTSTVENPNTKSTQPSKINLKLNSKWIQTRQKTHPELTRKPIPNPTQNQSKPKTNQNQTQRKPITKIIRKPQRDHRSCHHYRLIHCHYLCRRFRQISSPLCVRMCGFGIWER